MSGAAGSRLPSQTSSLLVVPLFGGLLFFFFFGWRGKDPGQEAEPAIQAPASHLLLCSWQLRALLAGAEGFPGFYPLLAVSSSV